MSLTISEKLLIKRCPVCGIVHAAPKSYFLKRYEDGKKWYCPNGHRLVFTEGESYKLRKRLRSLNSDLERERRCRERTKADLEHQKHLTRAQKAAKTRAQNKLKALKNGTE